MPTGLGAWMGEHDLVEAFVDGARDLLGVAFIFGSRGSASSWMREG